MLIMSSEKLISLDWLTSKDFDCDISSDVAVHPELAFLLHLDRVRFCCRQSHKDRLSGVSQPFYTPPRPPPTKQKKKLFIFKQICLQI